MRASVRSSWKDRMQRGDSLTTFRIYDVNIFTNDAEPFLQSADWLSQFGEVLIYQKEELNFYGTGFSQPAGGFQGWQPH